MARAKDRRIQKSEVGNRKSEDGGWGCNYKFVENIKAKLGIQAKSRQIREPGGSYHLRETQSPYNSDFTPENSDLRAENAYSWRDNH